MKSVTDLRSDPQPGSFRASLTFLPKLFLFLLCGLFGFQRCGGLCC